ncbi:hypothetical protein B0T21DRAFT_386625 [Apiosordaria backusii]|uniref:Heterokaryon incompatibility domain-containing protein n=1 Tax=Apiosordaria backusii TaxID=314023 RepID=A0AA40AN92_9PEZI|nr:hypothetical protein B0T21DRAFT_386625 [Apiosordaria backusii]
MRLLDTLTLELVEFTEEIPLYAILSHRWGPKELTLQDLTENKLCSVAASHGLQYAWVDTCCIDKTSSAELSEAMNSMYRWYQDSAVCFAFLGDVQRHGDLWAGGVDLPFAKRYPGFSASVWFTRGWTLQELIAPSMVIFLDSTWQEIDTKASLCPILSGITGIPEEILAGASPQTASIAQRMSWASRRKTARVEDTAYCLMGLFDVNMPMLYGEGEKAFIRLQEQIIKTSDDHTIFAWGFSAALSNHPNGGLLASSPAAFSSCRDIVPWDSPNARNTLSRVISTDNKGIHLKLNFVPGKDCTALIWAVLREHEAVARVLIEGGANLEVVDGGGHTPLLCAAESGQTEMVRLLIEHGANIRAVDEYGNTPFKLASRKGHEEVARLLTKKGWHWKF